MGRNQNCAMENTPKPVTRTAPPAITTLIGPFRWWKTFWISCAIVFPVAFVVAASIASKTVATTRYPASEQLGAFMGAFIAGEIILGSGLALVLCIAQTWALNAYYWSGRRNAVYYICLYLLMVVTPLAGCAIIAAGGSVLMHIVKDTGQIVLLSPLIALTTALAFYFVGRRIVATQIAKVAGTPAPLPPVSVSRPSPSASAVKVNYTWPLLAIAAAIIIAAVLIYAARPQNQHPQPSATTDVVLPKEADPNVNVPNDPDIAKGIQAWRDNDATSAVEALTKAAKKYPRSDAVFYWLGNAHRLSGDRAKARQSYERATQLNPGNADAWMELGRALSDTDPVRAVDACTRATALKPNKAYAWMILGTAYIIQDQRSLAATALERAVEIDPNLADAWDLLSKVYAGLGDQQRSSEAQARYDELQLQKGSHAHVSEGDSKRIPTTSPAESRSIRSEIERITPPRTETDSRYVIAEGDLDRMKDVGGCTLFESNEYAFTVCLPEKPEKCSSERTSGVSCFNCLAHRAGKTVYQFEILIQELPDLDISKPESRDDYFREILNGISRLNETGDYHELGDVYDYAGRHKGKEYAATERVQGIELVRKGRMFIENGKAYVFSVRAPKGLWSDEPASTYLRTFRIVE
jgi:tetratricopeptide (TPR) repeat protein